MKRSLTTLVIVFGPLIAVLGLSVPPAQAAQNGQFVLRCAYSHTIADDPIIVPRAEGVYFAGWTSGTFLHELPAGGFDGVIGKLRDDGALLWFKQFGSSSYDWAVALSIAGNGLYIAGSTTGELPDGTQLGESDGFLRKYPPNGTEVWTRQFGTTDYDAVYGMASDPKGVVAVGTTHGAFEGQTNAGDRDVFLVRIAFS